MTIARRTVVGRLAGAAALLTIAPAFGKSMKLDLSDLERIHGGRIGFCAVDRTGRDLLSWRGDERFTYCSTFKLFLAAAILRRVDAGVDRLDNRVAIPRASIVSHSPVTGRHAGSTLDLATMLQATVEQSDNSAANLLIAHFGGLAVWRHWYRQIGDRVTDVSRLEPELNRQAAGDIRDTTAPNQVALNLFVVLGRSYLRPHSAALLRSWLSATPLGRNRLGAGFPRTASWAHKSGTGFDGPANDIGMVALAGRLLFLAGFYDCPAGMAPRDRDHVLAEVGRRTSAALRFA